MKFNITLLFILVLSNCSTPTDTEEPQNSLKKEIVNLKSKRAFKKDLQITNRIKRADQFAMDGLYREAIQDYKTILRNDRDNIHALKMIGIISVKTGEYQRAISSLKSVVNRLPSDFESNYYLAEAYRTQDSYGDAIFRYKVALSINPDHELTMKALAWSYYKIRYYKAALQTALKLSKLKPDDTQVTIILARVLNKIGLHKKSLTKVKTAISKAPKKEIPYLESVLGDIYLNSGDIENAESAYKSALKEQPLLAGALLGLAKITLQKGKRPDLAITYLERASRIKPSLIETYFHLGIAQLKSDPASSRENLYKFSRAAAGDPEFSKQIRQTRKVLSEYKKRPLNSELEALDDQL